MVIWITSWELRYHYVTFGGMCLVVFYVQGVDVPRGCVLGGMGRRGRCLGGQ